MIVIDAAHKACPGPCRTFLPLDPTLWKTRRAKRGDGHSFVYCNACNAEKARETYRRQIATEEGRGRAREQRRQQRANQLAREAKRVRAMSAANQRRYYQRHADEAKARARARYARKVSTLEGRLAVNEAARMNARLRAEREGRAMRAFPVKNPLTGNRVNVAYLDRIVDLRVPAEPLRAWLKQHGIPIDAIDARAARQIRCGDTVRISDADIFLTAANASLVDVYDPTDYPEVYAT